MSMNRRDFLRTTGFLTASIAAGGAACDTGRNPPLPQPDGGVRDGGAPQPDGGSPPAPRQATGTAWKFPQSVGSGDPKPDSALLWTRVVPTTSDDVTSDPAAGDFIVRVVVTDADNAAKLGTNDALSGTPLVDASITVYAEFDHTIRHKVSGLQPAKVHYFQFVAGDVRSKVGCFKTAPADGADVAQLKLGVLACQDWTLHHWGAFTALAGEELDFVLHTGDYIYETIGADFQLGTVEQAHSALQFPDGPLVPGETNVRYAATLADYRFLYKKYRTDPRLQAVHERFAFVAVWDDHEFSDDSWRDASTYDNGAYFPKVGGDNKHEPVRRRAANRAWFEYMPADVTLVDTVVGFETLKIYRDLKFGKLAHLVLTDQRMYRADHIIPEAAPNPATGQQLGAMGSRNFAPELVLYGAEADKIAASTVLGVDELALVTMLGKTQRDWWKQTMSGATATWKLWGNQVALLKMGVNVTDAIATLLALGAIETLATNIQSALTPAGGNANVAAAIVAGQTAGASQGTSVAAAQAIRTADTAGTDKVAAATAAGLNAQQAAIAVAAFDASKAAAAGGTAAQVTAAAQTIAFGWIKPNVIALKEQSPFVIATGRAAQLTPFFQRFIITADQWDGYDAERRHLMKHLKDGGIKNVVALTGDLHAFYAGTVNDDFRAAGGGTPVMVDMVIAGVSSNTFFSFIQERAARLSEDLAKLVVFPLEIPVPNVGTVAVEVNLLDYTLGAAAPTIAALAQSLRIPLRGALAKKGVPEAQLDATTDAVLTGLQSNASFARLVPLAGQLAGLNSNPWLKYVQNDAHGYGVVTVTPSSLVCEMKHVNVGSSRVDLQACKLEYSIVSPK